MSRLDNCPSFGPQGFSLAGGSEFQSCVKEVEFISRFPQPLICSLHLLCKLKSAMNFAWENPVFIYQALTILWGVWWKGWNEVRSWLSYWSSVWGLCCVLSVCWFVGQLPCLTVSVWRATLIFPAFFFFSPASHLLQYSSLNMFLSYLKYFLRLNWCATCSDPHSFLQWQLSSRRNKI